MFRVWPMAGRTNANPPSASGARGVEGGSEIVVIVGLDNEQLKP